jgi:hypothetical protein
MFDPHPKSKGFIATVKLTDTRWLDRYQFWHAHSALSAGACGGAGISFNIKQAMEVEIV